MNVLIRVLITAVSLAVATALVPGIEVQGGTTLSKVLTLVVVALIFGIINTFLKPLIKAIGCLFYILTLGLIHIVINAFMLWITARITEHTTHWGLQIDHFWWTAIWAAILLSIVSWVLSLVVRDVGGRRRV